MRHSKHLFLLLMASLATVLLWCAPAVAGPSCNGVIIGSKASGDGSILTYHQEEGGATSGMQLIFTPRSFHKPGEIENLASISLPFPRVVPAITADYGYPDYAPPGTFDVGQNQWGLVTWTQATNTKELPLPNPPTGTAIGICDLQQVVLERCHTAREAVKLMGELIDKYGTCYAWHTTLIIVWIDPHEAWLTETSYHHWVARKIHPDEIKPVDNCYTITSPAGTTDDINDYDMASPDVISYAIAQGWYDPTLGKPFNWSLAYAKNPPTTRDISRHDRILALLQPKYGHITVKDLMDVMADHFDATANGGAGGYIVGHPAGKRIQLCTTSRSNGSVWQLRPNMPASVGVVWWNNLGDTACESVYMPIWAGSAGTPDVYSMPVSDTPDPGPVTAFWTFHALETALEPPAPAASKYVADWPYVRASLDSMQQQLLTEAPQVEKLALALSWWPTLQEKVLTLYSEHALMQGYDKVKDLTAWVVAQP